MGRVLLIEDNPLLQNMYKTVIEHHGHVVEIASDGVEGLEMVTKSRPDLILMDVMMPKLSGIKVLEKLKADPNTASIPVVIQTNLANEADAVEAKKMGAVKYLLKSENDPTQIAVLVDEILGKKAE